MSRKSISLTLFRCSHRESNIAVPGEWLFPLYEGPIDVDVAAQSKIRMSTEEFLEQSARNCEDMVVLNPKPTPTVPGYYANPSTNTDSSAYPSASSETDVETSTSDHSLSYTSSKTMASADEDPSASTHVPTEPSPAAYTSETSSFSNTATGAASLPTMVTSLKETSDHPTTLLRSSYDESNRKYLIIGSIVIKSLGY